MGYYLKPKNKQIETFVFTMFGWSIFMQEFGRAIITTKNKYVVSALRARILANLARASAESGKCPEQIKNQAEEWNQSLRDFAEFAEKSGGFRIL